MISIKDKELSMEKEIEYRRLKERRDITDPKGVGIISDMSFGKVIRVWRSNNHTYYDDTYYYDEDWFEPECFLDEGLFEIL